MLWGSELEHNDDMSSYPMQKLTFLKTMWRKNYVVHVLICVWNRMPNLRIWTLEVMQYQSWNRAGPGLCFNRFWTKRVRIKFIFCLLVGFSKVLTEPGRAGPECDRARARAWIFRPASNSVQYKVCKTPQDYSTSFNWLHDG